MKKNDLIFLFENILKFNCESIENINFINDLIDNSHKKFQNILNENVNSEQVDKYSENKKIK